MTVHDLISNCLILFGLTLLFATILWLKWLEKRLREKDEDGEE